jgi:pyruvate,water dikinase
VTDSGASIAAMTVSAAFIRLDAEGPKDLIGGKAGGLVRLLAAGERVPTAAVIPDGVDPDVVAPQLREWLGDCGASAFAVRSSGATEDGAEVSMAGTHLTELGVAPTVEAISNAVRRVQQSGSRVSALIQPMLEPLVAGVAFSADPVTGDRRVVIEAVAGLADRLMAGEATGARYLVSDTRIIGDDPLMVEAEVGVIGAAVGRIAASWGHEVDVEWAWCADGLWILQARHITALPIAPEIELPPGTWEKDVSHSPRPVSPLMASLLLRGDRVVAEWTSRWGLMIAGLRSESFGGEIYTQPVPLVGGVEPGPTPPWWVLGIAARVVPPIRRRLMAAARAEASGLAGAVIRRWHEEWKPGLITDLDRFRSADLGELETEQVLALGEQVLDAMDHALAIHFDLFVPYLLGVHGFVQTAEELLGWDPSRSLAALAGHSPASSEPARLLRSIAASIRSAGAVERVARADDPLSEARQVDSHVSEMLDAWVAEIGFRLCDYDVASPMVSEIPGLIASLLVAALAEEPQSSQESGVTEADDLSDGDRMRFAEAYARAAHVFPLREDNVHLTGTMPGAAFRRVVRELGSRLAAIQLVDDPDDVFFLTWDEVKRPPADARRRVHRRRMETAWVAAHPGPLRHGPEPGPSPDVRGLPGPARRVNAALLWAMDQELAAKPVGDGGGVRGMPCGTGTFVGPVRIVRTEADLARLRPGDVMVCPIATTAWSVVFGMIGAVVCDGGGALSHTAIVAREHGLPAVMATGNATSVLDDGVIVRVDGATGRVEPV